MTWELVWIEPYQREDGTYTRVATYRCVCAKCSAPALMTAPSTVPLAALRKPPKCKACPTKPKRPVPRHAIDRLIERRILAKFARKSKRKP